MTPSIGIWPAFLRWIRCRLASIRSGLGQDSLAEQRQGDPAEHLPFDHFDVVLARPSTGPESQRLVRHRALPDVIAGTAVIYSWDARAARLRFLSRG